MRDQVEEVKQKTDIVAVIGEQVKLTKAGRNYRGLCPFHDEKTPSFMVSPELQIYKCFGCGESGDVFTFLEKQEGMEFYEALTYLAEKVGVKITPRRNEKTGENSELIKINDMASRLYNFILLKHKEGQSGKDYLLGKRNLKIETIKKFNIGFAPNSPQVLYRYLSKKVFSDALIEKSGVVYSSSRGLMDRFRGRAIFPIADHRGNVIALGGRILPQYDTGKVGKYVNSPETPIYHKSRSLYGFSIAKDAIRKSRTVVVVEGEMDVVSSWQAGIKNVVAIKGTALTQEHISVLSRFVDTIIFALDSDFAGDTAAIRGLTMAQDAGLELKVADMGEHKDPDEYANNDPKGLLTSLEDATDAMKFIIDVIVERYDVSKGAGKSKASREITPILARIGDKIVQAHYIAQTAQKLQVPIDAVTIEVQKHSSAAPIKDEKIVPKQKPRKNRQNLLEERIITIGIGLNPRELVKNDIEGIFEDRINKRILDELNSYLSRNSRFDIKDFSASLSSELVDNFNALAMQVPEDTGRLTQEFEDAVDELKALKIKKKMRGIAGLIAKAEEEGDQEKLLKTQKKFQRLSDRLLELKTY